MPNSAMPAVDERSGTIAEYPIPTTGKFPNIGIAPPRPVNPIMVPNLMNPAAARNLKNVNHNIVQQQLLQNKQKRQLQQQQQLPPELAQLQLELQQQKFQIPGNFEPPPEPPPPADQVEEVNINSVEIIDRPHVIDDG